MQDVSKAKMFQSPGGTWKPNPIFDDYASEALSSIAQTNPAYYSDDEQDLQGAALPVACRNLARGLLIADAALHDGRHRAPPHAGGSTAGHASRVALPCPEPYRRRAWTHSMCLQHAGMLP